jgi:general secretion pathway protein G
MKGNTMRTILSRSWSRSRSRHGARNAQLGLTLLEIMIVIAILGLLVVIVVPRLMGSKEASDVNLAKIQVDKWKGNLDMWSLATKSDKGCSEIDLVNDVGRFSSKETTAEEFKDPWNQQIQIMCEDGSNVKGLYSYGPNKKDDKGEGDDIASWKRPTQ